MCTRQSRKVIWDMINTLFLVLQLSKILLLLSFSTRKHTSMASCAILSNFCEEQRTQSHPQYLSGLSLFPTTFLEVAVYLALFTDPEGDSCFSIYQIRWIKMEKVTFCKLKTSLSSNFVYYLQTFREFCQVPFLRFCCKCSMKIIFYLPVHTDKPKFIAFLVFVCTTASFIAQISSTENVLKRDAILALVAKR